MTGSGTLPAFGRPSSLSAEVPSYASSLRCGICRCCWVCAHRRRYGASDVQVLTPVLLGWSTRDPVRGRPYRLALTVLPNGASTLSLSREDSFRRRQSAKVPFSRHHGGGGGGERDPPRSRRNPVRVRSGCRAARRRRQEGRGGHDRHGRDHAPAGRTDNLANLIGRVATPGDF